MLHEVEANINPHNLCMQLTIEKFLSKHNMEFQKYYWDKEQYDIVRPFYVLTEDPCLTLKESLLHYLDITQDCCSL